MRVVFNYRKALRQSKRIQQITPNFSLPFPIELVPSLTFILFFLITLGAGYYIRSYFPDAFESTWFMWLIGLPALVTWLVTKAKPDGKNIYVYLFDLGKYFVLIKWPKKKYCHDEDTEFVGKGYVKFRKMVNVREVKKKNVKNANENNIQELTINKRGRRVGVPSSAESEYSDAK